MGMPSQEVTAQPQQCTMEGGGSGTLSLTTVSTGNSTPIMQLQRDRARHHYELHRLDQRMGERLYGARTEPHMP